MKFWIHLILLVVMVLTAGCRCRTFQSWSNQPRNYCTPGWYTKECDECCLPSPCTPRVRWVPFTGTKTFPTSTTDPGFATSYSDTISSNEIKGVTGANVVLLLARLEEALTSINLPVIRERTIFTGQNRVTVTTIHKLINKVDYGHRILAKITSDGQTVQLVVQSWKVDGKKAPEAIPKRVFEQLRKALKG